jgi:hypothetical protein
MQISSTTTQPAPTRAGAVDRVRSIEAVELATSSVAIPAAKLSGICLANTEASRLRVERRLAAQR